MQLTYSQLIELMNILSWPMVTLVGIFILRKPLIKLLNRFSSADEVKMSVGSLSIQAKAMRELHESIDFGFSENTVNKKAVEALIDTKIRSIQSAIEFELSKSGARTDPRIVKNEKIKVVKESGEELEGETLDISNAGIAFKSPGKINFHESVKIMPLSEIAGGEIPFWKDLRIVRIEQSKEGFYYGAMLHHA